MKKGTTSISKRVNTGTENLIAVVRLVNAVIFTPFQLFPVVLSPFSCWHFQCYPTYFGCVCLLYAICNNLLDNALLFMCYVTC